MAEAATSVNTDQTNTSTAANGSSWADSLDADTKTWVSGKGWDKLAPEAALPELIKGYRGAEKTLGVPADQIIRLPGKDAKPEDWRGVWSKLGAPEKPEDYEIKPPEGDAGEFLKTASTWFHELGIPKQMAQGLAGKWNEYVTAQQEAEIGRWNERFEKETAELKNEWGAEYNANKDLAGRVERATGLKPDELRGVERALGPKAYQQFLARFGKHLGEHRFHGDGKPGFGMSAEGAKVRLADLQKDEAWKAKYLSGDADAKAEFTRLNQIAYPEQQAA